MKVLDTLEEVEEFGHPGVVDWAKSTLMDTSIGRQDSMNIALGGSIYVIESEDELDNIATHSGELFREAPLENILYDGADWIKGSPNFLMLFQANNDAGGPAYLIPEGIVENVPALDAIVDFEELSK